MLGFSRLDPTPRRKLRIWDFLIHQVAMITKPGIRYLLDDEFHDTLAGGAVDATLATPGPGTRAVVDTDSKLSIGSGVASFEPDVGSAWGDPGVWYDAVTRAAGMVLVGQALPANTTGAFMIGFDTDTASVPGAAALNWATSGELAAYTNAAAPPTVGIYTATAYQCAVILRASGAYYFIKGGTYTTWTLLYVDERNSTATLYPNIGNRTSTYTSLFIRIPGRLVLPAPLAYDSFTRANGAIGTSETTGPDGQPAPAVAWTGGATWTVASNKMLNTPTLAVELLDNPGFEGVYEDESGGGGGTINLAPNWSNVDFETDGTDTLDEETTIIHGGASSQYCDADAANEDIASDNFTVVAGTWYRASMWVYPVAGVAQMLRSLSRLPFDIQSSTGTGAWEELVATARAATSGLVAVGSRSSGGATEWYVDDASVKAFALAELVNVPDLGVANVVAEIEIAVDPAGTQAGLAIGWDSQASPANGILVTHDGTNVKIAKNVAGTWTEVQSTAAAFSANAKLACHRDGSSVEVFYNNVKIGATLTISDAAIVAGTKHGAFSTNATPTMDDVLVFPRGDGAYDGALNRYSGARP